jgi:hypothetical protein
VAALAANTSSSAKASNNELSHTFANSLKITKKLRNSGDLWFDFFTTKNFSKEHQHDCEA